MIADVIDDLYNMVQELTGLKTPMISDETHSTVMENADVLNSSIIYDRDFNYNYFGFKVNLCFIYFLLCNFIEWFLSRIHNELRKEKLMEWISINLLKLVFYLKRWAFYLLYLKNFIFKYHILFLFGCVILFLAHGSIKI